MNQWWKGHEQSLNRLMSVWWKVGMRGWSGDESVMSKWWTNDEIGVCGWGGDAPWSIFVPLCVLMCVWVLGDAPCGITVPLCAHMCVWVRPGEYLFLYVSVGAPWCCDMLVRAPWGICARWWCVAGVRISLILKKQWQHILINMLRCLQLTRLSLVLTNPWQQPKRQPKHLSLILQQILPWMSQTLLSL